MPSSPAGEPIPGLRPGDLLLGLDEAGRGSVLGPLVVGAYLLPASRLDALAATGVTDSKRLSPRRREALRSRLLELGRGALREVPATRIDRGNLTELEAEAMAGLVDELAPDLVVIDAPVHPRAIPAFEARLRSLLSRPVRLLLAPKADLRWPLVGAASVLAKLRRDERVRALGPVGSGYPSDPTTRAWLARRLRSGEPLPPFVRSRWGTLRALAQESLF